MTVAIRAPLQNVLPPWKSPNTSLLPANPRLLLDRYLDHAADATEDYRKAAIQISHQARRALAQTEPIYRPAFIRWRESFAANTTQKYKTNTRVLVGFGGHHVMETGLTLHSVYGVPIIPGTALKGLAAHYCHKVWGAADPANYSGKQGQEGDCYRVLFGSTDEGGLVEFHDAWLFPECLRSALKDDVLTPHHGDYYLKGNVPPADYDDPVPVRLFSVSGEFLVAITSSSPSEPEVWQALALRLVTDALREWGVGGKTNQGYGLMKPV